MISFRQHVVSLVAVFLALAVGVALGGGPLGSTAEPGGQAESSSPSDSASPDESTPGAGQGDTAYAQQFASTAGARLYAAGLAAAPVAVLAMPDADRDVLKALSTQIQAAGGRVTGRYGVRNTLVDRGEPTLVDTLGSQLATQLADPAVDVSAPSYERLGQLVGIGIATTDSTSVAPDAGALAVRESLAGADLMASPSVDVANAPLVLVVLGPESGLDEAGAEIRASLVTGLAATATGVVVLGDEASAESGSLAALRARTTPGVLATVDGQDDELSQVSTVLALIGVLGGRGGAFGAASADAAVPLE